MDLQRRGAAHLARRLASLLALALVWGAAPRVEARLSDDAVRAAAREVLSDSRYDKTLPEAPTVRPRESRRPAGGRRRVVGRARPRAAPTSGSTVSEVVVYLLLAVIGVAVLGWLGRELSRRRRSPAPREEASHREGDGATARRAAIDELPATLQSATALAQDGRYEEAIHLLLRGAIETVARLARRAVEPAMTSRELLAEAALDPASERAFRDLVVSVERSLFGGLPVTGEDFARCARSFGALHAPLREWGES